MIPKIVHMSWKSKDVVKDESELIKNGLHNLINLNPDWDIQISTDEEVDLFLREALSPSDYELVKDIGVVPQTDLWRLIKLYNEGGVYMDLDRLCNRPLSELMDGETKCVLPTCADIDFSHDFMMSAPGNPVFLNTIKLYLERRRNGYTSVYFLGPQTYMHGVTATIFGRPINTDPGKEVFDGMRDYIAKTGFIKTYRESPPYNTVTYSGPITTDSWELMKRKFYADNGVKHWTGEW